MFDPHKEKRLAQTRAAMNELAPPLKLHPSALLRRKQPNSEPASPPLAAPIFTPLEEVQQLLEGVVLDDDPRPVQAQCCVQVGSTQIRLTLTEGRYHQVKRMVAAAGNRVAKLHRSQIGGLVLPEELKPGQWRWLSESELAAVQSKAIL